MQQRLAVRRRLACLLGVAMLFSIFLGRPAQAFTSRAVSSASRKAAHSSASSKPRSSTVVCAPFLEPALARAAARRLFSSTPSATDAPTAAGTAAAEDELAAVEWLDGGNAAKIAWSATAAATAAAAHKVVYSREPGVVNQVTVGGASKEATLRGLVPGSTYNVEVLSLPADGEGAVVVARGSLATAEEAAASKGEVTELSRLEIRVGKIVEIGRHPDADTLYVEKIDVGEAEPRTIVSGLVKYQSEAAMQGRDVIVLCNLKPRAMRGVTSHGMLLCASSEDHSEVVPLSPPVGASIGDLITVEGHASAPEPPGNRAGKAYDRVAEELFVDEEGRATYKGLPFTVPAGAVTGAIKKGRIS